MMTQEGNHWQLCNLTPSASIRKLATFALTVMALCVTANTACADFCSDIKKKAQKHHNEAIKVEIAVEKVNEVARERSDRTRSKAREATENLEEVIRGIPDHGSPSEVPDEVTQKIKQAEGLLEDAKEELSDFKRQLDDKFKGLIKLPGRLEAWLREQISRYVPNADPKSWADWSKYLVIGLIAVAFLILIHILRACMNALGGGGVGLLLVAVGLALLMSGSHMEVGALVLVAGLFWSMVKARRRPATESA